MRRRWRAALVVLLLVGAAGAPGALTEPARAQASDAELALLEQPAWVPLGGTVLLRIDVPAALLPPDEDVTVRLRIHAALTSTAAFARTIEGERLGNRIDDSYSVPVDQLLRDDRGAAYIGFGLTGSTGTPTFSVDEPGVYPLEVALRTDETLASFVTWIVVADPAGTIDGLPAPRVQLAQLWNLSTAPVLGLDGEVDADAQRELAPGGRVDDIATLLAEAGAMPISVSASPETLEAWQALAGTNPRLAPGFARARAALGRTTTQVLPATYVPIDLTSLEATGLGGELPDQLRSGSEALVRTVNVRPDSSTAFVDPVDTATLARLRGLLVDRVVVRSASLADDPPLAPFALPVGDATMPAAASSATYEDLLTGDVSPALRTQRLLAALSVLAFERNTPAAVTLATPVRWQPDVATQRELIAALAAHPYVAPVTIGAMFAAVAPATDGDASVVGELAAHDPAPFPISAARYQQAEIELAAMRSSLGPTDPSVVRGDRAIQLAPSTDNSPEEAQADLAVITEAADALQAGVSTARRRVTVTARRADIPLTFVNTTGKPVSVRVTLDSEKLLFPDGATRQLTLVEEATTERFSVEARASGSFTMEVTLTSADGQLRFGPPQRVSVRSGAFDGAGAALTVGALAFLALWWANHFRRTRRARRTATSSA